MMSFGYKTIKNKTARMRSQIRQCNGSGPRGVFPEAEVRFGHPPVTLTFSFSSIITEWKPNWMLSDMRWLDTGNVRHRCFMLTVFPTQAKRSTLSLQDLLSEVGPSFLKVARLLECPVSVFPESCGRFQNKDQFYWLISRVPVRPDVLELQVAGGCWQKRWISNRAHGNAQQVPHPRFLPSVGKQKSQRASL